MSRGLIELCRLIQFRLSRKMSRHVLINLDITFVTQEHSCVILNANGCGFDSRSRKLSIKYFHFFSLVSRQSVALIAATQNAMAAEYGVKWETEWLSSRFPLPTLLCAEYSMTLVYLCFCNFLYLFSFKLLCYTLAY